jgi:uncharacterized protein YuzE
MGEKLRISYDPDADAVYVTLRVVDAVDAGPSEVDGHGVIIDTDLSGRPRGYEFLAVRSAGIPISTLPREVSERINEFIAAGYLARTDPVEVEYA